MKKGPKDDFFGQGKYFCSRSCTVKYSMEFGETLSRDKNENIKNEPVEIEERKSSLKSTKEKMTIKSISGKRKDQKAPTFRWLRYLAKIWDKIFFALFTMVTPNLKPFKDFREKKNK